MSKSASRTRLYLFAYFHAGTGKFHDMLWHSTVESHLDVESNKLIEKVCAVEQHENLLAAIPESKRAACGGGTRNLRANAEEHRVYGGVSRRAVARRIRDSLQASIGTYWSIRIIEVGDFGRETRPVKHWNVERLYRPKVKGKQQPWELSPTPYLTGIALRQDARAQARALNKNYNSDAAFRQYKFRAVPVYA